LNSKKCALLITALALPLSIGAATAGDLSDMPKVACTDLKYSKEFLDKYPQAPAACLEGRVAEDGKKYGKFTAKVYLNSAEATTVQLLNVMGDPLTTFSFKPGPDASVVIEGEKTKFTDLKTGEKITFWVSEDRMTASELPGSTEESWAVLPPVK
jgi:hypothetical protein